MLKPAWSQDRACLVLALTVLWVGLVGGCGKGPRRKPVFPVTGKVLFEQRPTQGALVVFHPLQDDPDPLAMNPRGRVQADGTFTLTTYQGDDGCPAGEYAVTVHWSKPSNPADEEEGGAGISLLPGRYANPERSGLKARVVEGKNELPPFLLTR